MKKEIILSGQFFTIEKCSTCKNNKFDLVTNECPFIDLKISKEFNKSSVLIGNLKLLVWVVLKSVVTSSDKLNKPLAKLCAIGKWIIEKGW